VFGITYNRSIAKKYNTELKRIKFLLILGFFDNKMVIVKLIGVKNPNGIKSSWPVVV
jgi:hypothetical protein